MEIGESQYRNASVLLFELVRQEDSQNFPAPEEYVIFLKKVHEPFLKIVEEYGGRVERAAGSSYLAHFGLASAIENTPHNAVNAVVAVRNALAEECDDCEHAMDIFLRAGIGTGSVFVGKISSMSDHHLLSGKTIETASMLEKYAAPGQVLVCSVTAAATGELFRYRPVRPGDLPMAGFELLSSHEKPYSRPLVDVRGRVHLGDRRISSRLVGREKKMGLLKDQIIKLSSEQGGIVTITGEAGIGKSRLMSEVKQFPEMNEVLLLEGRAVSMGRTLSFHPVTDLMKQWAGIEEDDDRTAVLKKLEVSVRDVHPCEADEIVPFLAILMGIKLSGDYKERVDGISGEGLEKLIFKNICELLVAGARRQPLVLYFEDLHWADMSSIEFIVSLFRLAENNRILFILAFRPGYDDTGGRILHELTSGPQEIHLAIELEQLSEEESDELIENLLSVKDFPRQLREDIISRSDGNPFFIEEVVRSFVDQGIVEFQEDSLVLKGDDFLVSVPSSIEEVLLARIESLDPETRELVRIASVIGRNFFYRILAKVAEGIDNLDSRLSYLKSIDLFRDRMRHDELEYLFKHALAREAAYESLEPTKRRNLHLHIAGAIEMIFFERIEEFYGILSWHYSQGDDLEKTENYILKAGEEALKSSASREAIFYFSKAIDLYVKRLSVAASSEKLIGMNKSLALACFNSGELLKAIPYFEKVLKYHGYPIRKNQTFKGIFFIKDLMVFLLQLYLPVFKRVKQASSHDEELFALYYSYGESMGNISPENLLFGAAWMAKNFYRYDYRFFKKGLMMEFVVSFVFIWTGLSRRIAERIFSDAEKHKDYFDKMIQLNYLETRFFYDFLTGDWSTSYTEYYDKDVINFNLRIGRINEVTVVLLYAIPDMCIEKGLFKEAESILEEQGDLGVIYNHYSATIYSSIPRMLLFLKTRQLVKAFETAQKSLSDVTEAGMISFQIRILSYIAYIKILQEEMEEGKECLDRAGKLAAGELIAPYHISYYFLGEVLWGLDCLKKEMQAGENSNTKQIGILKKYAKNFIKKLLKNVCNVAPGRTEAYRLTGTWYLYLGMATERGLVPFKRIFPGVRALRNFRKAISWLKKSIDEGERLGACPELSRSYFEAARCMLEMPLTFPHKNMKKEACFKKSIGLSPEACLSRAEEMFRKMDLQWDLARLEQLKKSFPV